ncbi:polysaccharide biosynthesis C-terminal domain-containing protein [Halosimplex pelagicum]|uniref:Polysaccharide biosynthesis C-terminal domain-containing protein n=1 Tax=Halosimplex pelagicum TaxID=869886 RepID=A0A7D5PDS4_9EURY|nr:polysaccharide biosynthesis C-terminal domain-containing protein [Halosimplex pelagicum]QLH81340.1 polysaccharide biosynthesis C-terminal domain-containing protein [Halosimplex pelagicum]
MSRSIASSIFAIFSRKLIAILLSVVFTPIIVRLLGTGPYGRYATVISIFGLTTALLNSGTNDSIRKYLAEDRSTEWKSAIFGFHVRVAGIVALVIASTFAVIGATGFADSLLGSEFGPLLLILSVYVLTRQYQNTLLRSLMGLKLEKYSEPLQVLQRLLFSSGAVALAYLGWGVPGVLLASIGADIIVATIAGAILSNHLHLSALVSFETPLPKRDILSYVGGTAVFFACLMSLYHVDILMLSYWKDGSIVGVYKGALQIAEMLWLVPSAVQLAMLQSTAEYWQHNKIDVIEDLSSQITRLVSLLTILMAIGLAVLADSFVPLYLGADFEAAVTPLLYLLPGVIGFAVARPILAISQSKGDMRPIIIATLGSAVINLIANSLLIPEYGMVGAAIGTSLGYGSLPLFQTIVARYFGYRPFTGLPIGRIAVVSLLTGGLLYGVDTTVQSDLIALVVIPPVGGIVYIGLAVKLGVVTGHDLRPVVEKLPDHWVTALTGADGEIIDTQ